MLLDHLQNASNKPSLSPNRRIFLHDRLLDSTQKRIQNPRTNVRSTDAAGAGEREAPPP